MNRMDITQIKRSMHIDFLRLSASGKSVVWIFVLLPFVFAVVGLVSGDRVMAISMSGAVTGICAIYAVMMGMMIFSNEDMTGNTSMDGILPVSRFNQVFARYALIVVADVVAALEAVACLLLLLHEDEPPLSVIVGIALAVVFVALFLGGLVLPFFYRCPLTQAMGWAFGVLGLLFVLVFVDFKLMSENMFHNVLQWAVGAKLGVVPTIAIIGIIVAIVVSICSFVISVRIYEHKEL